MEKILEAVPKSVHERISRKLRRKKSGPKDISLTGRIAVKKTSDTDPRPIKDKIAEDILKYYKGNGKPRGFYKPIIEHLITDNIAKSGNGFSLLRLNEMRNEIGQFKFLGKGAKDKVSWIRFKTPNGMLICKLFDGGENGTECEISANYKIDDNDVSETLADIERMTDYESPHEEEEPNSLEFKVNTTPQIKAEIKESIGFSMANPCNTCPTCGGDWVVKNRGRDQTLGGCSNNHYWNRYTGVVGYPGK